MTNAIIDFESNPANAIQTLRAHYINSGDNWAMRESVEKGIMTTHEAAEAWIDAQMEAEHWAQVTRRDDDGYEWTDDVQVPYTDDVERAVELYQQWLEEDINEPA